MARRPDTADLSAEPGQASTRPSARLQLVGEPPRDTDATLVARCRTGQQAAASSLYRRHVRRIVGIVHRLAGPEVVEDVVQETFAEAFASLHKLRDPERFGAWLAVIGVRKAKRHVRRMLSDPAHNQALLRSMTEEGVAVSDVVVDAYRRLTTLPPRIYVAWILLRVEGYTIAQTAELCRAGTSSIKRWVARGDRLVQQCTEGSDAP